MNVSDKWMKNREDAVKNMHKNVIQASSSEITRGTAPGTSRKKLMDPEQVTISRPFGFISPSLIHSLKFDNAMTVKKQAVAVMQHIDSEIHEENKAILTEELKRVLM